MGDTSAVKRNVLALVNVNVDYSSPRVIDNLGNIRVIVKNDTSQIHTLENAVLREYTRILHGWIHCKMEEYREYTRMTAFT
jgi:hypothetical protein